MEHLQLFVRGKVLSPAYGPLIQLYIGIFSRTKTAFPEMWVITRKVRLTLHISCAMIALFGLLLYAAARPISFLGAVSGFATCSFRRNLNLRLYRYARS